MKNTKSLYHGHRFPAAVISRAVRWYFRFQLSPRDIKELLFERGVIVRYETIRRWCDRFGSGFAHRVKAARIAFSRHSICSTTDRLHYRMILRDV